MMLIIGLLVGANKWKYNIILGALIWSAFKHCELQCGVWFVMLTQRKEDALSVKLLQ